MDGRRASALLGLEVRVHDVRLGVVVDVLLDAEARRTVGLDVRCGDRTHRFLPLAACEPANGLLLLGSALVLSELRFYREHGRALGDLRGRPVRRGAADAGSLVDLVLGPNGEVRTLVVETDEGEEQIPAVEGVVLSPDLLRPAV